jgi:hypothetical protein
MLTREEVLARGVRRYTTVHGVPEWGDVCLQSLSDSERMCYLVARVDTGGNTIRTVVAERRARLLVLAIVDATTKKRVFKDEDWPHLDLLDIDITGPVYEAARPHCNVDMDLTSASPAPANVDEQKKTGSSGDAGSPGSSPETTQPGTSDC